MILRKLLAASVLMLAPAALWAEELIMVEQPGCYTCQLWDREIAPIYPKTEAGKFAPLRREHLRKPPKDVTYARRVSFTPTFILVRDGAEIARLEGYPGEDFFWWHIEKILKENSAFTPETQSNNEG